MSIESEIKARNIRSELLAEKRKQSKPSTGPGARASANSRPPSAVKRGDGIDRAALWRKAMAVDDEATAERRAAATSSARGVGNANGRGCTNYAEMWRRGHEKARAMGPIRCDE